jgi:hypothetical protein
MIKLNAENLKSEYDAAKREREFHLEDFDQRIKAMSGKAGSYRDPSHAATVNHQGAYMAVMLPRLIQRNPRAAVNPRGRRQSYTMPGQTLEDQAKMIKEAADIWVEYCNFDEEHALVGRDFLFDWGVTKFINGDHPGHTSPQGDRAMMPMIERIPLYRFVMDPQCDDWRKARWHGDVWEAELDDLISYVENQEKQEGDVGGWNLEAIKKLQGDSGLEELGDRETREAGGAERKVVVCVDFWFRDHQPDDELGPEDVFNGCMVTLAIDGSTDESAIIREPTPYFGPPVGPYELFGCYTRYKTPWPQSPLSMSACQEALLRDMVSQANKSSRQYRKVVLVPGGTQLKQSMRLAAVGDDLVIECAGLDIAQQPVEIEMGGITQQQILNMQHAERQLNLVSGMDQAQHGEVTGDGTATEHAIAEGSSQTRIGYVVDQFHKGVRHNLERFKWYLCNDEDLRIPFLGGDGEVAFIAGGADEGVDPVLFDLLSIDIEPMSMERVTEGVQKRRMLEAMNLLTQIIPLMRQFPEVDWIKMIGMIGDAMNLPDLGSMIDVNMLNQLVGVPANVGTQQGGGALPPEQLAREVAGRQFPSAAGVA